MKSVRRSSQNENIIETILFNNFEETDEFDIAQLFKNFVIGVTTELEAKYQLLISIPSLSLLSRVKLL